jgi:hypothetical protein
MTEYPGDSTKFSQEERLRRKAPNGSVLRPGVTDLDLSWEFFRGAALGESQHHFGFVDVNPAMSIGARTLARHAKMTPAARRAMWRGKKFDGVEDDEEGKIGVKDETENVSDGSAGKQSDGSLSSDPKEIHRITRY